MLKDLPCLNILGEDYILGVKMDDLKWIGHASFLLQINGVNVYIDPFDLRMGKEHADVILVTHPHYDHFSPNDIRKVADNSTQIFVPKELEPKVDVGRVTGVVPDRKYSARGIAFETVPAYNTVESKLQYHPKANGWVGYIVNVNGRRIYHPGDTDFIEEMKGLKLDLALVPIGGTYVMDVHEAVEAANSMEANQVSPMHYKMLLGREGSAKAEGFFKMKAKNAKILKEIQEPKYSF